MVIPSKPSSRGFRMGIRFPLLVLAMMLMSFATTSQAVTVLYNDRAVEIEQTLPDPNDLWVVPEDLTRINDFVLKPEGACLEEICIPIVQNRDNDIVITRSGQQWFSVTGFANKLRQSYVVDHDSGTWSFGEMPIHRDAFLNSAYAPDFELQDRNGKTVKLSDFRGKKVLLVTWASW